MVQTDATGSGRDSGSVDTVISPRHPAEGATPEEIVDGFLDAMRATPAVTTSVARAASQACTIRRDVERLRTLGYPVDALSGPTGGYRLRAGTAMPPLLLDDEEAVAIAVGLRAAAGASIAGIEETAVRALVKLEQILPSHLRRQVGALRAATATLPAGWWAGGRDRRPRRADGARERLPRSRGRAVPYRRRDGEASRRRVEPSSLVSLGHRWYLVAWDREREDWRTFRLDRLERPAAMGTRFAPREVPGRDPLAFVARSLRGVQHRHVARVTLHASADEPPARSPACGAR